MYILFVSFITSLIYYYVFHIHLFLLIFIFMVCTCSFWVIFIFWTHKISICFIRQNCSSLSSTQKFQPINSWDERWFRVCLSLWAQCWFVDINRNLFFSCPHSIFCKGILNSTFRIFIIVLQEVFRLSTPSGCQNRISQGKVYLWSQNLGETLCCWVSQ